MPDFKFNANRDAWSTIRGFVYQVDLTIERWLSLEANHILELEAGEDIDLLSTVAGDPTVTEARLLEQVKNLEKNVTLRTPGAVEFIANAVELWESTPPAKPRLQTARPRFVVRQP